MYRVRIVEYHGHNGDEVSTHDFPDYEQASKYILEYYFDNDVDKMIDAEEDTDEWYCEEADAWITIE